MKRFFLSAMAILAIAVACQPAHAFNFGRRGHVVHNRNQVVFATPVVVAAPIVATQAVIATPVVSAQVIATPAAVVVPQQVVVPGCHSFFVK